MRVVGVRWALVGALGAAACASGEPDAAVVDTAVGVDTPLERPAGAPSLFLNEILAVNAGAWPVDGATPDGIELFYAGEAPLDLQGFSVSDDPEDPALHTFAEPWVIPPGGFVVLWADEGARGGPDSLAFALSAGGEALVLTDPEGRRLDAVRFGEQQADVALARVADGDEASGWAYVQGGTPGASNAGAGQP
jgi:hypothetical protein